jgi:hypothetical protein
MRTAGAHVHAEAEGRLGDDLGGGFVEQGADLLKRGAGSLAPVERWNCGTRRVTSRMASVSAVVEEENM